MQKPQPDYPHEERFRLKDLLYFGRSQRLAILVLLCLLLPAVPLLRRCTEQRETTAESEAAALVDSLYGSRGFLLEAAGESPRTPSSPARSGGTRPQWAANAPETFAFDPNRADSLTLRRLGLPPYVVRNLLRYRAAGGVIRTPEKFAAIYGMKAEDARRLGPCLLLDDYALPPRKPRTPTTPAPPPAAETAHRFTHTAAKYPAGTRIDLNRADTAQLKRIRGIGSWRARRIVDYRERLGGYSSPAQLAELPNMPDSLQRSFYVAAPPRKTLPLNSATLEELLRHPYLNYRQCRTILEHRRKRGPIRSLRQLLIYEEFTEDDLRRLQPYLSF